MKRHLTVTLVISALLVLAVWAYRKTGDRTSSQLVLQDEPIGIMGTDTNLVLITDRDHARDHQKHLDAAETELRRLESLLSTWIETSQISRLNDAAAARPIAVGEELRAVLDAAGTLHERTGGAFDISIRPVIEVWRQAAANGRVPTTSELEAARMESSWDQIALTTRGVVKATSTTRVDVDGIAKGYAVDRALEVLRRSGATGGLVEVGGDLRVFGRAPGARPWIVSVRSPYEDRVWAELGIVDAAVCSSGDYARFMEIDGQRLSHIIDPRTGRPTEQTHAVTVVGPDAMTADGWATALSVLGLPGLELLETEPGLEAMVVTGSADTATVHASSGFADLLLRADFVLSD